MTLVDQHSKSERGVINNGTPSVLLSRCQGSVGGTSASTANASFGRMEPRACREHGRLPLPKGEGWGEGLQAIESSLPPHPHPLPVGEREFRRAADRVRAHYEGPRQNERNMP